MTHSKKSKNNLRRERGEEQVGRKVGTTRARKPIGKQEFDRLVAAVGRSHSIKHPTRMKLTLCFTLLYITGCRISEIVEMSTDDLAVMIATNEYSLSNATKTRKARLIILDADGVQAEMLRQIAPKFPGRLFARNGSDKAMTTKSLTNLANAFIHRVLGPLYSSHSFRAGYITESNRSGNDLEHIRQDIGHKSIATTARYIEVTAGEISRGKTQRQW